MHRALTAFILAIAWLSSPICALYYLDESCRQNRHGYTHAVHEADWATRDAIKALDKLRRLTGSRTEEEKELLSLFCRLFDLCQDSYDSDGFFNGVRVMSDDPDFGFMEGKLRDLRELTNRFQDENPDFLPGTRLHDFSTLNSESLIYFCSMDRAREGYDCNGRERRGVCDRSLNVFAPEGSALYRTYTGNPQRASAITIDWEIHNLEQEQRLRQQQGQQGQQDHEGIRYNWPHVVQLTEQLTPWLHPPFNSLTELSPDDASNLARPLDPPLLPSTEDPNYYPAQVDELNFLPYQLISGLLATLAAQGPPIQGMYRAWGWHASLEIAATRLCVRNGDNYRLFILGVQLLQGRAGFVKLTINDDGKIEELRDSSRLGKRSASAAARQSNSTLYRSDKRTSPSARRRIRQRK